MHKDSLIKKKKKKKTTLREIAQKLRKEEQSVLYLTHCLNPIHIAIKFYKLLRTVTYLLYPQGQSPISSKGSNSETEKGKAIFFVCDTPS